MATQETHVAPPVAAEKPLQPTHAKVRLGITRRNSEPGTDPFDTVEWEVRDAIIPGKDGPSFEQRSVDFPTTWSQTASRASAWP